MWSVVLHNKNDLELSVLESFNTRTNAQLFAESYVAQLVLEHNGSRDLCNTLDRKAIEQKLSDPSITNENCYYIIHNNLPWGMTVNAIYIRQLETVVVDEVDTVQTQEVDEVVKVPKQITVSAGWFSRAKTHTVEEDKTIKVPKQIVVKQTRITTNNKRIADSTDVLTVNLVYNKNAVPAYIETARKERTDSNSADMIRCNSLARRLAATNTFATLDGVSSVCVKFCKTEFSNEFSSYKSYMAINNMGKLLDKMRQDVKTNNKTKNPLKARDDLFAPPIMGFAVNDNGLRQRKTIINETESNPTPKSIPAPPVFTGNLTPPRQSGSSLAHLNNDILARHREMFGQFKPRQAKKFDDATIENLCNEIERAIKAAECESKPEHSDSDWDSESDSESYQESDSESEVSEEDIFKPEEIMP